MSSARSLTSAPELAEELRERFVAIVGARHAITTPEDMAPYLEEPRGLFHGATPLVLMPASTDEVAAILALAHAESIAVVPQGGNTGLVGGQVPGLGGAQGRRPEVLVSLKRMRAVRSIDTDGNTMTVEAGLTLAEAQAAAETVERLFPLSLASEGSCTIGGNLATNAGGVAVLAYGAMRALTLGLEVVLADGRIWDGLRALPKDNTGLDLRDLFIGSEGTLGIITAAVLKLFPRPVEQATAIVGVRDLDCMARLFARARRVGGPMLTAFEIMPRFGLALVLRHAEGARDPLQAPAPWYALIELSSPLADEGMGEKLERLLGEALDEDEIADAAIARSLTARAAFWALRERLSEVQKREGASIKNDVSVPIAHIPEFIARADARMAELVPGCRPLPFGHFGDGNIHYNISQPPDMEPAAFLAEWDRLTDAVNEIVLSLGGSVSAEHGIGRLKRDLLARVKSEVEIDLMRQIKRTLDPKNILNPGKMLDV